MACTRGNKMDYDNWAAMGNPGWSYKDLLPYFLKMEDANVAVNDSEYRAKGGPLAVSDVRFKTELGNAFVAAAQQAGFPYVDYNGKQQMGVSYMQGTLRNGLRSDAENSYLRPVRHRKNLKIRTEAHVTKILIRPGSKEAYGVEYRKNGRMYHVIVKKEVILSAGGLNSPQILMLSGVGPRDQLEEFGIPVIKNLPVGTIMYDHVTFLGAAFLINEPVGLEVLKYALDPQTYVDFMLHRKGPLTSFGIMEAVAFVKTNLTEQNHPSRPDIELLFIPAQLSGDFGIFFKRIFNVNDELFNSHWKPLIGKPAFTVLPILLQPLSKGNVRLRSTNPFDTAKYTQNYFSDPDNLDIKRMIVAIREIQRIASQPSLKKFEPKIVTTPFPGCDIFAFDSDEYWECAIRAIPGSLFHQQSTCRMGPTTSKDAVVDARLRVHGMRNLRVADISIFPTPVSGHTVCPAYAIGEKTADMIKEDWTPASNVNDIY
nr:unnamed protein product [Callosobruchus chinensis]